VAAKNLDTLLTAHIAQMTREAGELAIRARVQTVYLGGGRVLARVLGRYKMVLDAHDIGFARHLMFDGYWESWATRFLAGRLKPGMSVVDIGANYGYYTLLFGGSVGSEGKVIAVEPNPNVAAVLQENVDLNGFAGFTEVHRLALSDRDGQGRFFVPVGEPKNGLLADYEIGREGEVLTVPMTTLDALLDGRRIDIVKIDAEGGEPAILTGMADAIARSRPLLVLEFNAARYADPDAVLDPLLAVYERISFITFEGKAERTTRQAVLTEKFGEDWLLVFE
jgi:FkbM family methyltransferase